MKNETIKLRLVCILISLISANTSQAQDWAIIGNAAGGTDFIGTTNSIPFKIYTANAEVARFQTTGELGLGITAPASWFHILTNGSGTVDAKEVFRTEVATNTETNWRMMKGSSNIMRMYNPASGTDLFFQAPRGSMKISTGYNGTTVSAIEISGGNNSNADGNVLIGNFGSYSPSARLHIKGNGYSYLFKVENSSLSTPAIIIEDDEQQFFKANSYTGHSTQGAFNFDYSPSSSITDGIGSYQKTIGNASNTLQGMYLKVDNTNSGSSSATTGLFLETYSNNASAGNNITLKAACNGTHTQNLAGQFESVQSNDWSNTGIVSTALNSDVNTGIYSEVNHSSYAATNCTGIVSKAFGATNTIAIYAEASDFTPGDVYGIKAVTVNNPSHSGTNAWYGVFGEAPTQTCGTGSCAGAAGFFNGDVYAVNGSYSSSDLKLKDQIQPISNATSIISQLQAKQYLYKLNSFPELNLPQGQHYGFIAQDVEVILPNLVKEFKNPSKVDSVGNVVVNSVNVKAIHYEEFIPLLVAAFNEQKALVDSLLNALQNPTPIINPINTQKVSLSNINSIILNQNDPNPFTESTNITYSIPEEVIEAKIIFTSSTGVIINTVIINERGAGQLEVYASDLSKGIYQYTLICDGKVIASKKMVKQ